MHEAKMHGVGFSYCDISLVLRIFGILQLSGFWTAGFRMMDLLYIGHCPSSSVFRNLAQGTSAYPLACLSRRRKCWTYFKNLSFVWHSLFSFG
jgi:hypothetical protein